MALGGRLGDHVGEQPAGDAAVAEGQARGEQEDKAVVALVQANDCRRRPPGPCEEEATRAGDLRPPQRDLVGTADQAVPDRLLCA